MAESITSLSICFTEPPILLVSLSAAVVKTPTSGKETFFEASSTSYFPPVNLRPIFSMKPTFSGSSTDLASLDFLNFFLSDVRTDRFFFLTENTEQTSGFYFLFFI